ncbi:MAG: hypothetical protein ACXW3C_05775 [Pyrinomonadaceae bacterium]
MKTRKTTFVALLSQTVTTTSTLASTSRSYSASVNCEGESREEKAPGGATPMSGAIQRWCEECATPMAMVAPELAATLCFKTTRAIYRLVEAGRIHFSDGPEGVMVCPASLMRDWAAEHNMPLLISPPAGYLGSETRHR